MLYLWLWGSQSTFCSSREARPVVRMDGRPSRERGRPARKRERRPGLLSHRKPLTGNSEVLEAAPSCDPECCHAAPAAPPNSSWDIRRAGGGTEPTVPTEEAQRPVDNSQHPEHLIWRWFPLDGPLSLNRTHGDALWWEGVLTRQVVPGVSVPARPESAQEPRGDPPAASQGPRHVTQPVSLLCGRLVTFMGVTVTPSHEKSPDFAQSRCEIFHPAIEEPVSFF